MNKQIIRISLITAAALISFAALPAAAAPGDPKDPISQGMSRQAVIDILGNPRNVTSRGTYELLEFPASKSYENIEPSRGPLYVILKHGAVDTFGQKFFISDPVKIFEQLTAPPPPLPASVSTSLFGTTATPVVPVTNAPMVPTAAVVSTGPALGTAENPYKTENPTNPFGGALMLMFIPIMLKLWMPILALPVLIGAFMKLPSKTGTTVFIWYIVLTYLVIPVSGYIFSVLSVPNYLEIWSSKFSDLAMIKHYLLVWGMATIALAGALGLYLRRAFAVNFFAIALILQLYFCALSISMVGTRMPMVLLLNGVVLGISGLCVTYAVKLKKLGELR